jgi:hypothetical protein
MWSRVVAVDADGVCLRVGDEVRLENGANGIIVSGTADDLYVSSSLFMKHVSPWTVVQVADELDDGPRIATGDSFGAASSYVYANAHELLVQKHQDYGPRNIADSPGGSLNGLRVRMFDKLARLNNLIDSKTEPANEPLRDSFVDLLNYAAIGLLVLDGNWPTGRE